MAEDQSFQQKIIGSAAGVPAAADQQLHLLKGLPVNDRLMGPFHHNPVFRRLLEALFGLIADLDTAPLDHVADVGLIFQHFRDPLAAPQAGIGPGGSHLPAAVSCRCGDPLFVEGGCNLPAADSRKGQGKDVPHHRRHFLVNDDLVFLRRVHLVAIHGLAADELSLALLIPLDALDLFGDVLGVHVVHDGPERGDVVGGGVQPGVNAIQKGDVPHPVLWKVPLHIVAGHDVVPAQTG